MFKVKEIAERFGVSQHTVGMWIASGELRAIDVSRSRGGKPVWRIKPEALEAFEQSRMPTPPAPRTRTRKTVDDDTIAFY